MKPRVLRFSLAFLLRRGQNLIAMPGSILTGDYVYEEVYPAFKEGTDEKEKTALLNQTFLKYLSGEGIVLSGHQSLKVADVGCGPCDTVIKYLKGVAFPPGFIIRATDYNEDYAGPQGKALKNLKEAQTLGALKISEFSVKRGNAFGGHLLELLAASQEEALKNSFRLSFLSHLMYHALHPSDIDTVLKDVAFNVLSSESLGILYHVAHRTAGTFQYFRDRFGSNAQNTQRTDTPTMNIADPPTAIERACEKNEIPCEALEFSTNLSFYPMKSDRWEIFQRPEDYEALSKDDSKAFENLKRLYFIVQRSPKEFAADSSPTGLLPFLAEAREAIEKKNGVMILEETMQVIAPPEAPRGFLEKVGEALVQMRERFSSAK